MAKAAKYKVNLNVTISPWVKERCVEMANSDDFASLSDVVAQALSEFIGKYDERKNIESDFADIAKRYLETEEGQKFLKNICNKSTEEEPDRIHVK